MRKTMRKTILLPLLAFGLAGAAAATPPKLVSSTPADAAVGMAPTAIRLGFDQAVLADGPHFALKMTAMPGMAMNQPIAINAVNHDGGDKLDLGLASPLATGRYELAWSVSNTAGETSSGVLHFGVR